MSVKLLTPQQVADQLGIPMLQVRRLKLTRIRLGEGRGQFRYRQEDLDRYVRERLESPQDPSVEPVRSGQSRSNTVVFRGLTPLKTVRQNRLAGQGRKDRS